MPSNAADCDNYLRVSKIVVREDLAKKSWISANSSCCLDSGSFSISGSNPAIPVRFSAIKTCTGAPNNEASFIK